MEMSKQFIIFVRFEFNISQMRKYLIFETVMSIASPPPEEEGNVDPKKLE